MVYTFGLVKHTNIRYRDSVYRLARYELLAMLQALSVDCEVVRESFGGADFLSFECRPLSEEEIGYLSYHSLVAFLCEKDGELLRPLLFTRKFYLEEDLPEILKYKGKTSVSFVRMAVNMALTLTPFLFSGRQLTLLDPLCGKGTACFCALQYGMNAVGMDLDRKAVHEASEYFSRYLKIHMLKHSLRTASETAGSRSLPVSEFTFADTHDHYRRKDTRYLRLGVGDTSDAPVLCRRNPAHLIVTDLPYGVQHAPRSGTKPESFTGLLRRSLPCWKDALLPGGVIALSFNTLTLPAQQVHELAVTAGLVPCEDENFLHLRHEVEQAVIRDVVFLKKAL